MTLMLRGSVLNPNIVETWDRRQIPALNPIKRIIQTRDFSLNDVNAQDLNAFCPTLFCIRLDY